MRPPLALITGVLAVIAFDTVGSLLSRSVGFNYSWLTIGSVLIYAAVGLVASRESILGGIATAALVGIIDSTIGWWISWKIGPGRVEREIDFSTIMSAVVFVTILAGVSGSFGALLGRALKLS